MRRRRRPRLERIVAPETGELTPWFTRGGGSLPDGTTGLPKHVRVGGQIYRVFVHTSLFNDAAGKVQLDGSVSCQHRLIVIAAEQPRAQARLTLAHEVGHVYLIERQRSDPALERLTDAQVESVCDLIAEVLEDRGDRG